MLLMEEAERIARDEHGSHKIAVISGECCALYKVDVTDIFFIIIVISAVQSCRYGCAPCNPGS